MPCLHFNPVTADSSVRRPSPAPGRSIFMMLAVLPVVLSLNFHSITVQNRLALYLRSRSQLAMLLNKLDWRQPKTSRLNALTML
ncbi:DUF1472 domain-containing protein [Escherichia coli]|nr:DUF1472 domain-containing protein [Escherichia coli]EFE8234082.1 DUF1472 domain-containing protein [Escherichia coli]NUH52276.1 DUF1472 domain-containing protein [Citrobacter portucalensis]